MHRVYSGRTNAYSKGTGIVSLGIYSEDQLRRMLKFVDKDEVFLQDLKKKPVIVCVKDALGDHNGALSIVPNTFEGRSATTLYFEVTDAKDESRELGKYADAMKERGITYDTVVLAAHGIVKEENNEGNIGFYLGRALIAADDVYTSVKRRKYPESHEIFTSSGLQKLFANLTPNETGEIEILLLSCEQGNGNNLYQVATSEVLADLAQSSLGVPATCIVYGLEKSTNLARSDENPALLEAVHGGDISAAYISSGGRVEYRYIAPSAFQLKGLLSTGQRKDFVLAEGDWARRPTFDDVLPIGTQR